MSWFSEARFGMFIHWGLYSAAGGRWGKLETPWVAEWLMRKFQIPCAEYAKLARDFNPEGFDAEKWIRTARDAGMKYMVITSKHHDGFAMFHSTYDKYNIVDATPFGRDPLAELAEAARKYGIRLGFYYSQEQDWHEAGATGNTWDFPEKTEAAFDAYLHEKVFHQVRELLTRYGEVSQIWFDTPQQIKPEQCAELRDLVRRFAPECLINSRIGCPDCCDYESLDDNQLPSVPCTKLTEGIGTMNESWGYKPFDNNYRSARELLKNLAILASRNANYMLNVGPDGRGLFPLKAVSRLKKIGSFLKQNGEALYGAEALKFWIPMSRWQYYTCRDRVLYIWCFEAAGELRFYGLRTPVKKVAMMNGTPLNFDDFHEKEHDFHRLVISLPKGLRTPFVVKAECGKVLDFNPNAMQAR